MRADALARLEKQTGEAEKKGAEDDEPVADDEADINKNGGLVGQGQVMPREHTQVMRHVMTRSHTEGEVVRHELYYHLLVRPRPVAGKMRFRCLPDRLRSRSYPLHPSEDRPALAEDVGDGGSSAALTETGGKAPPLDVESPGGNSYSA